MRCFIHNYSAWGEMYQSQETVARGSFGDTSTDPCVRQDRICSKCGWIQSRRVKGGYLDRKEKP